MPTQPKRPLTAVEAQLAYARLTAEQLLSQCYSRIPGFAVNLFCFPAPLATVMVQWRYDFNAPLWSWSRTRPQEVALGGTYNSLREALVSILNRVDRFDTWCWETRVAQESEATARAQRAAAAAPVEKPSPEQDEGDEVVQVEDLPPVTPLEENDSVAAGPGRLI
jgi:hypothetical protein